MKITNFTERQNAYIDLEKFEQTLELFENYNLDTELIESKIKEIEKAIYLFGYHYLINKSYNTINKNNNKHGY